MATAKSWDVVIAGAGIIGGAIAFELARRGLRVVLLDKHAPGREASWAAAGMLAPPPHSAADLPLVPLARASLELYPEFVAAVEDASGARVNFQQRGAIEALFSDDAERELNTLVALHHGLGLQAEALPLAQAFELEPALNRALGAAALLRFEAAVDNRALTSAVLRAARGSGAEVRAQAPVEAITLAGGRSSGVMIAGERLAARHVVIAAGCFSSEIAGIDRYAPVRPVRGQMVALHSEHVDLRHVIRSKRGYIVPRGAGICVIGSTLENAGFNKRITPAGIAQILAAALEIAPGLRDAEMTESWSGLRPDTPDHMPALGPTDVEGLWIATGHYRNGILLAPITAKLIASWITGERLAISCEAFSPLRFAESAERLG
jgi:glycine oxidase